MELFIVLQLGLNILLVVSLVHHANILVSQKKRILQLERLLKQHYGDKGNARRREFEEVESLTPQQIKHLEKQAARVAEQIRQLRPKPC